MALDLFGGKGSVKLGFRQTLRFMQTNLKGPKSFLVVWAWVGRSP